LVIAIYPGRFDPVTNGHLDIARRAAALFERVVIGVYDAPANNPLFNTQERVDMVLKAVSGLPNVDAKAFSGLAVAFAKAEGAKVLVRGIRAVTDFEAEFDMALMNKKMAPEVESVYMMSSLDHLFIRGARIREVASFGYDVRELVPPHVAEAIRNKLGRR